MASFMIVRLRCRRWRCSARWCVEVLEILHFRSRRGSAVLRRAGRQLGRGRETSSVVAVVVVHAGGASGATVVRHDAGEESEGSDDDALE